MDIESVFISDTTEPHFMTNNYGHLFIIETYIYSIYIL